MDRYCFSSSMWKGWEVCGEWQRFSYPASNNSEHMDGRESLWGPIPELTRKRNSNLSPRHQHITGSLWWLELALRMCRNPQKGAPSLLLWKERSISELLLGTSGKMKTRQALPHISSTLCQCVQFPKSGIKLVPHIPAICHSKLSVIIQQITTESSFQTWEIPFWNRTVSMKHLVSMKTKRRWPQFLLGLSKRRWASQARCLLRGRWEGSILSWVEFVWFGQLSVNNQGEAADFERVGVGVASMGQACTLLEHLAHPHLSTLHWDGDEGRARVPERMEVLVDNPIAMRCHHPLQWFHLNKGSLNIYGGRSGARYMGNWMLSGFLWQIAHCTHNKDPSVNIILIWTPPGDCRFEWRNNGRGCLALLHIIFLELCRS